MKSKYLYLFISIVLFHSTLYSYPTNRNKGIPDRKLVTKTGVCPPFYLYTEDNELINPVEGIHSDKPYSPKQTCGKCHDYDTITEGYHFQQGKDETAKGKFAERYQWVTTPGNYGGNWCSPAPLYNYLSQKKNDSPRKMDMTSFTFITNGCATCHPGGGSLEYDRDNKRYDKQMSDMNFVDGADNNFDGDYYQAHWKKTGVIEADCMLCHVPEYKFKERNANLKQWNFRWLATVGSDLAKVEGSIKENKPIKVEYNLDKFDSAGKLSMHIVREPRNETCLNCHAKPQWKKRGASFSHASDVHIAKGLKCVDCHSAGSMAFDDKIKGKEVHQFGKGDDPGGNVRNDLDNTMRTCQSCHIDGNKHAPIAKHSWLPSLHLEKLSCQTCHIPERRAKAALAQVSDVYNPGTKISPPAKHVWTFYDQALNYWNHYGELNMFTFKDQPSDPYIPQYAKYKGQIFPVNMIHSSWPAIYTEGKKGLDQPKMKDIHSMWMAHKADKNKYPKLSTIKDDNKDEIPELNTSDEIESFIESVTAYLKDTNYNLDGKKVVWVNNDRMYLNGKEFITMEKEIYEASPYASVHKYSHDIAPARNGLGINGCTDCHSLSSDMFFRQVVKYPFGEDGKPVYEPQYKKLGFSAYLVIISAIREQYIKPIEYVLSGFMFLSLLLSIVIYYDRKTNFITMRKNTIILIYLASVIGLCISLIVPDIGSYILPERLLLDKNHFWISVFLLITGLTIRQAMKNTVGMGTVKIMSVLIGVSIATGLLMFIKWSALDYVSKTAYTMFDLSLVLLSTISLYTIAKKQIEQVSEQA